MNKKRKETLSKASEEQLSDQIRIWKRRSEDLLPLDYAVNWAGEGERATGTESKGRWTDSFMMGLRSIINEK